MNRSLMRSALPLVALLAATALAAESPPPSSFTGKDTTGAEVKIPAEGRVSVIMFLRPGQPQSEEAEKLVLASFKQRKDVQLLSIVSGDGADGAALKLVQGSWGKAGLAVIADAEYTASGQFGVKVWPTTVVVGKPGAAEVAHLAGMPVTYGNDLSAYVDFATGKLSQAALQKALADHDVVEDSVSQKAARHVEVAMRVATKGLNEEARGELAKALALKPTEPRLILTMARVQLMINEVRGAESLLADIKAGTVPAADLNVLKAWAAVEKGDFELARALLKDALTLNPDPAEALYLQGRVSEHDGDSKAAAAWYRKAFEHSDKGKAMGAAH